MNVDRPLHDPSPRYSALNQQEYPSTEDDSVLHTPNEREGTSGTKSESNDADIAVSREKDATHSSTFRKSVYSLRWWLPEFVATVLSVASFASIIGVLHHYDGKAQSELHLPSGLTLNGIIAALSSLNRACLMVPVGSALSQEMWLWFSQSGKGRLRDLDLSDSASRGAWGSFTFLFSIRGWRFLAFLGALTTILSLAFGTFTQQILSPQLVNITDTKSNLWPGNIPRSATYESWTGTDGEGNSEPFLDMKAAVYNGMLTKNVTPVMPSCPSGGCTWPVTPSLAVCGACVPAKAIPSSCCSQYDATLLGNNITWGNCTEQTCDWSFPSGRILTMPSGTKSVHTNAFRSQADHRSYLNATKSDRLYVAKFDVLGVPYQTLANSYGAHTWSISSECSFWMCVQSYDTVVQSGRQVQSVHSTFDIFNLEPAVTRPNPITVYVLPELPGNMSKTTSENFTINKGAHNALRDFLSTMVEGSIKIDSWGYRPSSDVIEGLWSASDDLNLWAQNVAISMTNVVRTSSPHSRPEYNGASQVPGFNVRWKWLTLPAAIVVLSIGILISTIIQTARSPVYPWKGSPLLFILFGVEEELRSEMHGHSRRPNGIGEAVGKRNAVLMKEGAGLWKFKVA